MEVGARFTGAEIAVVARGGEVRPLPPVAVDAAEVEALPVRTGRWGDTTVEEVLIRHEARSLVVLHRGRLAYEWYGSGGGPDKPNRCYSVTKSFTGTLAAVAVAPGPARPCGGSATCCPRWPGAASPGPRSATSPT